jgi:putative chitinase
MTPQELAVCTGARIDRATEFLPFLEDAMHEFQINTPQRQAAFLAQVGHESGGLHWLVELWGPTDTQLTGRGNYKTAGDALGVDLIAQPELLGEPALACRSAGWFWSSRGLNELADAGDFERITRRVNGGLTGYPERLGLWEAAKQAIA